MRRIQALPDQPVPERPGSLFTRDGRWPSPLPPTALVAGLLVCLKLGHLAFPLVGQPRETGGAPRLTASGQAVAGLDGSTSSTAERLAQALAADQLFAIEPGAGPAPTAAGAPGAAPVPATPATPRGAGPAIGNAKLADVAQELAQRREALEQRERDLELREAVVTATEGRIAKQLERLEQLRAELKTLSDGVKAKDEAEIAQLIKMYESMKAKNAAQVFNELELKVLLPIARKMRESKLAAVMALMDPVKAKQITAALSQPTQLPKLP